MYYKWFCVPQYIRTTDVPRLEIHSTAVLIVTGKEMNGVALLTGTVRVQVPEAWGRCFHAHPVSLQTRHQSEQYDEDC